MLGYLAIGHITLDHIDGRIEPGGPALYSALTARSLGARVALHTAVGADAPVQHLLHDIAVTGPPTPRSTAFAVRYDEAGHRTQHVLHIAPPLTQRPPLSPRVVHLAPECNEIAADLLHWDSPTLLCITPQGWLRTVHSDGRITQGGWTGPHLPWSRIDAMVLSEEDVGGAEQIDELAARVKLLVVTRAHHGAQVYQQGVIHNSPAFVPARESDPTGAGDVFAAAFFLRLAQGHTPLASADWANCVASFAVEQPGTLAIPTAAAVETRWREGRRRTP